MLSGSRTLIVSEYRGLTVKEIAEIRRALAKQDVTYRVVKNRLLKIAAEDTIGDALSPRLVDDEAVDTLRRHGHRKHGVAGGQRHAHGV